MSHRACLLACLFVGVLFFGDALWGDRTVVPAGDLFTVEPWKSLQPAKPEPAQCFDQVFQFYPWADFFRQSIYSGKFPLWNPYNYLGTPFFANPQTALLFPLSWLHVAMPLRYSFTVLFILKLSLLALGMYAWLRSRRLEPQPALLGALVFALSMHTIVGIPYPYSNVTVVFPWALLAASKLLEQARAKYFLALTATSVLIIVAGQPQSALVAFLAIGALTVVEAGGRIRERTASLAAVALALGLSAVISAVQWLPSLAYVEESMVRDGPRIIRSTFQYTLGPFLHLLVPDFFGTPERIWGFPGYPDIAFYSSIVAVFLAGFAFSWRMPGRDLIRLGIFLAVSVGVLLGLPPFESLLDLPGLNLVRRNKFVFLIVFVLAELAARGADDLSRARPRTRRAIAVCCVLFVPAAFGFWWFREFLQKLDPAGEAWWNAGRSAAFLLTSALVVLRARRWTVPALLVLVLLDVGLMSYWIYPRGHASNLYPKIAGVQMLTGDPPRIYAFDGTFPPNTGMVCQLQDVRGYDVMTPRRLFRFMQAIDPNLGNAYDSFLKIDPNSIHRNTLLRRIIGAALEEHGLELENYFKFNDYWSVGVSQITRPELFETLRIQYVFGSLQPPSHTPVPSPLAPQVFTRPVDRFALFESWVAEKEESVVNTMSTVDLSWVVVIENPALASSRSSLNRGQEAKLLVRTAESSA
ncbi:MAG: hypothetical protein EHM18_10615, partial [Acidobacteria bacterium]